MAGYRDTSSFDPWAYETSGRPLRPYNWVQWIGVALIVAGVLHGLAFLLGEAGVIPQFLGKSLQPGSFLPIIGITLVNSRREPGTPAGSEQLKRNRKVLLITTLVCTVILGGAVLIHIVTGA